MLFPCMFPVKSAVSCFILEVTNYKPLVYHVVFVCQEQSALKMCLFLKADATVYIFMISILFYFYACFLHVFAYTYAFYQVSCVLYHRLLEFKYYDFDCIWYITTK